MTNIQTKLLQPTLTLNEAQERIRLAVKDAFFKRQLATLDGVLKKIIEEALAAIAIPTLKDAARRSLTAFYREQRRIIGAITPAMLITYLSLLKLSEGGVKSGAGDSATRQYTASVPTSIAKKTVAELPEYLEFATPLRKYTKDYFRDNIEPVINRLADEEAIDPDSQGYLGRRETLRTRAEREVRHESHINEIASLKAKGTRLVIISSHANCSKRCQPFQGKVFSLDGTSGKTDDGREYEPIEVATDIYTDNGKWKNGLFGFNCRHRAMPYSKGYKPPVFSAETEKKQYKIEQKQRYLERGVRHWRIKAAEYKGLDDEAYKKARQKADAWTKRYQEYSVQNKRAWDPERIKVDAPKKSISDVEAERITKHSDFAVHDGTVERREFVEKFNQMSNDETERREFYRSAKEILSHRSGENGEDLYLYNTRTKTWCKSTDGKDAGHPEYTDEIKEMISKANPGELIAFHNHPNSMPPSSEDVNAATQNGYRKGYIFCHDGKIFEYSSGNSRIGDENYNIVVAKYKNMRYNEYEAQLSALNELSDIYGFTFREIK